MAWELLRWDAAYNSLYPLKRHVRWTCADPAQGGIKRTGEFIHTITGSQKHSAIRTAIEAKIEAGEGLHSS